MSLHAAQVETLTGENGINVIRERAAARTLGSPEGVGERVSYPLVAPDWLPGPSRHFANYFHQPIVSSPQTWGRIGNFWR